MLGLPFGIAAVVLGIYGVRRYAADHHAKGKVHAWFSIVVGSLSTLAWGALWVLVIVGIASN